MSKDMKKWEHDSKQDRVWTFTASKKFFGEPIEFIELLKTSGYQWAFQEERGAENGFLHYQGYLKSDTPIRGRTLRNFFNDKANLWYKGKRKEMELLKYVQKEDTRVTGPYFSDYFETPVEKTRIDTVQELVDRLNSGERLSDVYRTDVGSSYAVPYLEKVNAAIMELKSREERELTVKWLGGRTASGKTSGVLRHYRDQDREHDVFRVTNYRWPFDKYEGQKIIIFDEFVGQIDVTYLNNLLDRYQCILDCRGVDRFALWEEVWFISNLSFDQIYADLKHSQPGIYAALYRRFHNFGWKESFEEEIEWENP